MKIVTLTRITVHREAEKRKFNELCNSDEWVIYESIGNLVTFEKILELIVV